MYNAFKSEWIDKKSFDEGKYMPFFIADELLKKFNNIWDKVNNEKRNLIADYSTIKNI